MALRCAYVDLDGTLLGRGASLFADAEGDFSLWAARALQACERAGVEVVLMSGRREAQVAEDARLIGQRSYIFEAGSGVVIDGERTLLCGPLAPTAEHTVYDRIEQTGAPALLLERYAGRLEHHEPWHLDRDFSHLFRGLVDVAEANAALTEQGIDTVTLIDNGTIGRTMPRLERVHAYHLLPRGTSKAAAVAAHLRARGHDPAAAIAVGDSREDLGTATAVGRFFCVANGPERDPELRRAVTGVANATVTDAPMGEGVYEAIVGTLARER